MLIAALLICSLASAVAGSCGYTMIGANFNRYGRRSYRTWDRAGAEDEFPEGLR